MSKLFSPVRIGALELPNRIVIPPMCQYSAVDGKATDWHTIHLGNLALSGAGLLIVEATAVEPDGRISPHDLGLWDDETAGFLDRVVKTVRKHSSMPLGIQLAHAGRKASVSSPWAGDRQISVADGGWQPVAPSPVPFRDGDCVPLELTRERIVSIIDSFVASAERAARIGFDLVEVHAAHGYLLHQFLSPLSNKRGDEYGGSLENRMRLVLDVFKAVRGTLAKNIAVGVRISATDWADGGWDVDDSVAISRELEKLGCDYMHVSNAGLSLEQQIAVAPGFQVPFARKIKENVGIPVVAVGLVTEAEHAEAIVATGDADLVAVGRGLLFDPRWPWHAAAELGARTAAPKQYRRAAPHRYKNLFEKE